jgi:hypothetical protein
MTNPATASDVNRLIGDADPLVVERILATGASVDEIDEALREAEDERGFGEEPHQASSARVAEVIAVLNELAVLESDEDEREENVM